MSRVYIGRLARDTRERDLEDLFQDCGTIREINLKNGYGFVEFKHSQDARDAVYKYHGKSFLGERIIVEIARGTRRSRRDDRGREDRSSRYRVMVENIPEGTSWQDLKDLMRKAGEVIFADIFRSRPGEGVVEFAHRSDMEYALRRLDGAELKGSKVRLFEDSGRRSARRSRSRSVSRSRSAPRHRSSRRRSPSYSRSRSRSRSPRRRSGRSSRRDEDTDMKDRSPEDRRSRSASPSRAKSRSPARSRSRSPAAERSRSPSRSCSRSPARNGYSDAE